MKFEKWWKESTKGIACLNNGTFMAEICYNTAKMAWNAKKNTLKFEEWMELEYDESEWDEGYNRYDMQKAFEAGRNA